MIQRSVELHPTFKIYSTTLQNQLFLSISLIKESANLETTTKKIYDRISEILIDSSSQIIHERCFAKVEIHEQILKARASALRAHQLSPDTPVTFVEGGSCFDSVIAGFQIRALKPISDTHIRTIHDQGIPKGRSWSVNGSTFYILQGIDGGTQTNLDLTNRTSRSEAMFHQAERLLRAQGANYQDVVRTWIYISDILDWYGDFNVVRNKCYSEYGFIHNNDTKLNAEQMYLPASTGIEGKNPSGSPATMDVFAVRHSQNSSIKVRPLYGLKQRSPFRYGSAFSRAIVIEEPGSKLILVSGTASINEDGKSVFLNDPAAQIKQTLQVVSTLINPEGATLQDICEATVFMKRKEDFPLFQTLAEQFGISQIPSVNVIADVCRDELLFEIDAAFILEKDKV